MLQVFSKGETCFRSMWLKRLVSREAIDNVDEYSDRYLEEQPEARLDELDHGNPMSFHTIRTSFCRIVFPIYFAKNVHKFTLDVTYVQKGVQLVTKVCYYLEFSYIYKHLIINKKALCLIAEGCTSDIYN